MARRLKTMGHMANLASTVQEMETRIQALLTHYYMMPADEADKIFLVMNWVAVWQDARKMHDITQDQEAEARKDPQKVAEIADIDL